MRKLARRKGAAIEMAIMVLVFTMAMSIVILTTSLLQHSEQVQLKEEMSRHVVLEQIGEDFCAAAGQEHTWVSKYPEYDITINGLEMSVKKTDSENTLLRVSLENDGGAYRILTWNAK